MLRVLLVSSRFPDSRRPGMGHFVGRAAEELARRPGVEVEVLATVAVSPLPFARSRRWAPLVRGERQEPYNGLRVTRLAHSAPRGLPSWPGFSLMRKLPRSAAAIHARFPFDVIAAQFLWPEGPAALAAGRRLGVPVSLKARGHDLYRWLAAPRGLPDLTGADGFLAVSDELRGRMIAAGFPAERIEIHYTGIDRRLFSTAGRDNARRAMAAAGPVVLVVGNLVPRKRPLLALEAFARLSQGTLLFAGTGPEGPGLERRIRRLGLSERVRLLGAVPHQRMADLYRAADVTLHTAASEGLANAWVESLACGTPVVTSQAGAACEIIVSPAGGRVVADEPAALAAALAEVIRDAPDPDLVAASAPVRSWADHAADLHRHLTRLAAQDVDE